MVLTGRVTGNMMTSMKPTNEKLKARAARIVSELAGVSMKEAAGRLERLGGSIREALEK
jgi:N-acetylmuramic acid 6-phosphate etherase